MKPITFDDIAALSFPKKGSHKGQNGRLLIIGGSHLFHAASIWALEVASRVVDLVHYSSVPENNELVMSIKKDFHDGIVIPRAHLHDYIDEDDCILIGPGMTRDDETRFLTHELLTKYPSKQWVIDAGALQMLELADIPVRAVLTPHHGEFAGLWEKFVATHETKEGVSDEEKVAAFTRSYPCILLLKGEIDIVGNQGTCVSVSGGNEGMTKGGTGDVLAGLIAALSCFNDPYRAALAGSFINKAAGDTLYASVGPFYNASDLVAEVPRTMKSLFLR
jgi:NAD(P)H-hydrate epimerase